MMSGASGLLALAVALALAVPSAARAAEETAFAVPHLFANGDDQAQERQGRARRGDRDTDRDTDSDSDRDSDSERRRGRNVCFDRNNDGICDDRRRRADACVDRDRDGFCDAVRRDDDDFCIDRNGDGRCDTGGFPGRYPKTLPEMISVVLIEQGRRSPDVNRWLGGARVRLRYLDADRNGVPERVTFLDAAGQTLQIWVDANRDGRADRVEVYRDGRQLRVIS